MGKLIHENDFSSLTEKSTPVSADTIIIADSADSNNVKTAQVGNLPGGGGASSLDGLSDVGVTTPSGAQILVYDGTTDNQFENVSISGDATLAEDGTLSLEASAVDDIGEIDASLKSGSDGTLVTGTAGTSGNLVEWDANGDAVDSSASLTTGTVNDNDILLGVNSTNSFDATAASSIDVSIFNDDGTYVTPAGTQTLTNKTIAVSQITELSNLTAAEGAQLENINSVTISNTQWGYLGSSNQGVATTDDVTFADITYTTAIGGTSALGNLGATETIDWSTGTHFTGTLDSDVTISFSNDTAGQKITVALVYDGTAQRTITHPTVKWAGGSAPTTPSASGEELVMTFLKLGTTIYGSGEIFS